METSNSPPGAESRSGSTPFFLACVAMVAASVAVAMVTRSSPLGMGLFLAGIGAAMVFLVLPTWLEHRACSFELLGVALGELERRQYDLDSVRREHRKALTRIEEFHEQSTGMVDRLEEQARQLAEVFRLKEDLLAVRQDGQRLQRRLEDWEQALTDHCDDQFRLLSHDGVSPDYHAAVQRGLEQLARCLRSLGLDVVQPACGEPFDDRLHSASQTGPASDQVPPEHVLTCLRPGYRRGETILRRAEVRLALPPTPATPEVSA
jgi:molecular chaperone GrpE (heat shock protein)